MEIRNAWADHPDYVIDLVPEPRLVRVWHGDVLLAETRRCIRLEETRHVDRWYVPVDDVHWEHFEESVAHTVCPFKGLASYWHVVGADPVENNVVWAYPEPFAEVAGIGGHVSFYDDRLRIEFVDE
jgi:uncharacterized protein (DUF427 family)